MSIKCRPALYRHDESGAALGLETLSDQISVLSPALGTPVAAINGDFYQRERAYAGAPRGLQVVDGELLSSPGKQITFWLDVNGEAHASNVGSKFEITWPVLMAAWLLLAV